MTAATQALQNQAVPLETVPSIFVHVPKLHPVLPRCEHGVYNPEGEARARYCTICTPVMIQGKVWKRIKTAVGPLTLIKESNQVHKYRQETNLAVKKAYAKRGFLPPSGDEDQGAGDLHDLKQTIDVAIWEAKLKYGDGMNEALAYKIAENQANKFLNKQHEEQTVAVTTRVAGKQIPVLDEFGKQKRVAKYESFDDKGMDEEGEPRENSRIEEKIVMRRQPPPTGPTLDKFISDFAKINRFPLLRALVDGWKPGSAKRIIGELFLALPDTTVREFPGVSKSNAARVLKVVKAEFSAVLEGDMGQDQKV